MSISMNHFSKLVAGTSIVVVLSGCTATATKPEGVHIVRTKLTQLQSDSQLVQLAPLEFNDAERSLLMAEKPTNDKALGEHRMLMADRKVDIAGARAKSRLLLEQRKQLSQQGTAAQLASRTQEVKTARNEAMASKATAEQLQMKVDAEQTRNKEFQKQLGMLNAKATDRGMVMTLSDLSFATGKAELKPGVLLDLNKLAAFLNKYQDRNIVIEGNTDNVGGDALNLKLSKRRATAVRDYLVTKDIDSGRLTIVAKGKGNPIDTNETSLGRQHNRRVDILISNTMDKQ